MNELPLALRNAIESGECVLSLGAGIGKHLLNPDGKHSPNGLELAKELAEYFSIDIGDTYDLAKISEIIEIRKGRAELEAFLRKRLVNLEPDENLQWLFSLRWKAIYTTNYDNGIQRAYELNPNPPQNPVTITITPEIHPIDTRFEVPIYHLHGTLFSSSKPQIIIAESDYSRFRENRRMLFELLKIEFATSTILYIGYSNQDPNWKTVQAEISSEFYPSPMPRSFRIDPDTDPIDAEILKSKMVETINTSFEEFVKTAQPIFADLKIEPDRLKKLRTSVPTDLLQAFEKSPVAIARLLTSWNYVNQAPFHETPNVPAFLRGDRPNWALISSRQHFERDIEESIYETLLDYATSDAANPNVIIVLGPAGYGTSTLMMSLAARLVNEKAGMIFMLKPGYSLLEGDVEFALSISGARPFFVIDNAADNGALLNSMIHKLKETKKAAMFILGERLNEWRQCRVKPSSKEFEIEPLSDPEINRLLDCLTTHGELNKLEHLSRDLQFSAIKINYRKELLVAMREATEGKSFDAIIEDEYRGIGDPVARRLYLIVCCFFQHGAYIRDCLLAQLINIPLAHLYSATRDATEGVVIYDCIDEDKGSYAARARHRTIAEVVWERCGDASEQEKILQLSLTALNLNYKLDKDAFENFIRSDRMVDRIRSLEGKIRFFEMACRKDPTSPYVRQHYARMLSREDKAELALSQIEEALKLKARKLILFHTKGMILSQLALSIESPDIARRRLAQSEDTYYQGLRMDPKDEYCYQGLAQLYFGWAKRTNTPGDEAAEYIAKAENIIGEGLRLARIRDSLWIESSKIQQFLGDRPACLKALETAVAQSPGGIVARYLLGREYRREGFYQKALDILGPIIKNHPDEFRSFIEYAIALLHFKRSYKEPIAVLRLSTLFGLSDPRFVATLGGMLFMEKEFTEAEIIFSGSSRREFTWEESNTVFFSAPNLNEFDDPLRIEGKVAVVKAGYALIDTADYPRLFCPGSKFDGVQMRPGLRISFELGFSAKRPVALHPRTS